MAHCPRQQQHRLANSGKVYVKPFRKMIAIHFIMIVDGIGFTNKNKRLVREKASFVASMQNDGSLSFSRRRGLYSVSPWIRRAVVPLWRHCLMGVDPSLIQINDWAAWIRKFSDFSQKGVSLCNNFWFFHHYLSITFSSSVAESHWLQQSPKWIAAELWISTTSSLQWARTLSKVVCSRMQ